MHSITASASAAEVRPLHEHYRATRTVFLIDLPGYGFSERSDRDYTPRLMTDALHAMVGQIWSRCGPVPVDALAVSLSCEYLARAAAEVPAQYRSVALVSPTGLDGRGARQHAALALALPSAARAGLGLGRRAVSGADPARRDPLLPGAHLGRAQHRR